MGQGVCGKIFKALNLSSFFQCFSRNPKSNISTSDHHHRSDPAKATELKLVVPQKDQNLSFASNKVHVEYNHSEITMSRTESPVHMLAERDDIQNQDYRFSRYIDHVKNKIKSSYDDDPSKFEIRTTAIVVEVKG